MNEKNPFEQEFEQAEKEIPDDDYISGEDYREQLKELSQSKNSEHQKRNRSTWKQVLAIILLTFFGLTALLLWATQFVSSFFGNADYLLNSPYGQEAASVDLRSQDTDNDGLSDYDELNFYNTSPYLDDSDSDGILDKAEIDAGEDPNCPLGQKCLADSLITDTDSAQQNGTIDLNNSIDASNFNPSEDQIVQIFTGNVEADNLRQLLRSAGMSADMLNQISDEELLSVYEETLKSQAENLSVPSGGEE